MTVTLLDRPIITDTTRRQFLTGAAAAALLAAGGRGPAWTAPSDGGFPVTVDHRFGSTVIPAQPRRIVTVGLNDHDAVYALGAQPVAASPWFTGMVVHPWSEQAAGAAVPVVLEGPEQSLETIFSQRPDLILAIFTALTEQQYERLSAIAPIVAGAPGFADYETPWQEQTRLVGRLPTYQNLDAVREGREVFPAPVAQDALSYRTVLSMPWALELIVAAFDGDPTTEVPS